MCCDVCQDTDANLRLCRARDGLISYLHGRKQDFSQVYGIKVISAGSDLLERFKAWEKAWNLNGHFRCDGSVSYFDEDKG